MAQEERKNGEDAPLTQGACPGTDAGRPTADEALDHLLEEIMEDEGGFLRPPPASQPREN